MTDTVEVQMETAATEEAVNDTSNKEEQDESEAPKPRIRICMFIIYSIAGLYYSFMHAYIHI